MSVSTPKSALREQKVSLRKRLIRARQSIPPQIWRDKSDRICHHLKALPIFPTSRIILAYWSFRGEPDLGPLLLNQHRWWGLPRCQGKAMYWHRWYTGEPWPLQKGSFGITEPHPQSPGVDPEKVDLILVPAVACDVKGYRLGYGGGYYDRMLSDSRWANKPTIGIVFEYARLPALPRQPWDRPLDGICTESGLFLVD